MPTVITRNCIVILLIQIQVQEKGVKQASFFSGNSSGYPILGQLVSGIDSTVPKITSIVPKITSTVPGIVSTVPKIVSTVPEIVSTVPEIVSSVNEILNETLS
jgi:phage-related protein